jgi:UDP-4-amino-4,6-dideoxy-N-acetyl-beta-L-altrosamine N-acetyltransferase
VRIEQEGCRLRDIEPTDLRLVLDWRNREEVRAFMFTDHVIGWDEHVAWYERMTGESDARCLLFERVGRPAGVVGISGLDDKHGVATWGFYMGGTGSPKGTAALMLSMALDLAFSAPGVRKIRSEVFAFNERSLAIHARLGFQREGLLRRERLKDGEYRDVVLLALFDEEWSGALAEGSSGAFPEDD